MMDQAEKLRDIHAKEKKLTDDLINKKTFYQKKYNDRRNRVMEKSLGRKNEESFFERLRR